MRVLLRVLSLLWVALLRVALLWVLAWWRVLALWVLAGRRCLLGKALLRGLLVRSPYRLLG